MFSPVCAIDLRRDHDLDAASIEHIDDALLGIIGPVGEQRAEAADDLGKQGIRSMKVMKVAGCQVKGDRISERVAQCMQLGAQSAFAAPDLLARAVPPFAPALD